MRKHFLTPGQLWKTRVKISASSSKNGRSLLVDKDKIVMITSIEEPYYGSKYKSVGILLEKSEIVEIVNLNWIKVDSWWDSKFKKMRDLTMRNFLQLGQLWKVVIPASVSIDNNKERVERVDGGTIFTIISIEEDTTGYMDVGILFEKFGNPIAAKIVGIKADHTPGNLWNLRFSKV